MSENKHESIATGVGATGGSNGHKNTGFKNVKKKLSSAINLDLSALGRRPSFTERSSPKYKKYPRRDQRTVSQTFSSDLEDDLVPVDFNVQYLGFKELKSPGLEEFVENVNLMYENAKPCLKIIEKSIMTLSNDSIIIKTDDVATKKTKKLKKTLSQPIEEPSDNAFTEKENTDQIFKPRRILYCGIDSNHQRVFSFYYQFDKRAENIHLHVLCCKTKDDAKHIAKYLAIVFKNIQSDLHRKEKEEKRHHSIEITKLKLKSSSSQLDNSLPTSPTSSIISNDDGSCSGMSGSGEWIPRRFISQLSIN